MGYEVRAEMVGNVLRVPVEAGAVLAEGDTVIMLESMKMEIPVLAESAGTVLSVCVAPGDVVRSGDLIAVLDGA